MCRASGCSGETVRFRVPPGLRAHAPGAGPGAELCLRCLRTGPADGGPTEAWFAGEDPPLPAFPTGEAGAALALTVGLLDSLALRRDAVEACCTHAEGAGGDVLLALDRLADGAGRGELAPHVDVDRRRRQLADFLA
jgi:hypothetical protein